jgi:hypothetical protein|tara:strand:- start:489 stop:686 length:198 start_codon:yes stop_codon:yes gene_type:complete
MNAWTTTLEWVATQFNETHLEDRTEIEATIIQRLVDEGYLSIEAVTKSDGTDGHKLMFRYLPESE